MLQIAMEMVGNSPVFNLHVDARSMTATNENIDKVILDTISLSELAPIFP
jgi:hypothetical protein